MLIIRKIKDLMVDVYSFPRIPSDISLKQAIGLIKNSMLEAGSCLQPMVVLVFDKKGLVGTLRLRDILKGLEPNFLKTSTNAQGYIGDTVELSVIWESLFDTESKELAEKPVSEVMSPITAFVGPDDPVVKAAYLMIRNDLLILPVMEGKKRLLGLIRMIEVFNVLSGSILEENGIADNVIEFKKLI